MCPQTPEAVVPTKQNRKYVRFDTAPNDRETVWYMHMILKIFIIALCKLITFVAKHPNIHSQDVQKFLFSPSTSSNSNINRMCITLWRMLTTFCTNNCLHYLCKLIHIKILWFSQKLLCIMWKYSHRICYLRYGFSVLFICGYEYSSRLFRHNFLYYNLYYFTLSCCCSNSYFMLKSL